MTASDRPMWAVHEPTGIAHRFPSRHAFLNFGEDPPQCGDDGLNGGPWSYATRDTKRRCSGCARVARRERAPAPRLVVHGVTAAEWTAKYGVEAFSHACSACGRMLTTTIPFVQGTIRGLMAPTCECGNERTPYAMVRDPKRGDLFDAGGRLDR